MKWIWPFSPSSITGKQTLTGDKPIERIHRGGKELQDAVVVSAEIEINGKSLDCEVKDNVLKVSGTIPMVKSTALDTEITYITGIVPTLTDNGSDTLILKLAFTASKLDLATGKIESVTVPDQTCEITGGEC